MDGALQGVLAPGAVVVGMAELSLAGEAAKSMISFSEPAMTTRSAMTISIWPFRESSSLVRSSL